MLKLLMIREKIKEIYSTKSVFIDPAIRFIATLISMLIINSQIGALAILKSPVVVLGIAAVGAVLTKKFMVMMILLCMVGHIYAIDALSALVVLVSYIIMYLLFFRFSSKYSYVLIAVPLLYFIKIPFLMPVLLGLMATLVAIIPMAFGTMIYFYLNYFSTNYDKLINMNSEEATDTIVNMINNVYKNPAFFYTVMVFALVIGLVYFVKRLSVDYSWLVSAISGGLLATLAILIGCNLFDMSSIYSMPMVIVGGLISTILAWLLQFFVHSVDYTRTEYTQFEDDEYYYYVKAVPKIQVVSAEKNIKRINARKVSAGTKNRDKKKRKK